MRRYPLGEHGLSKVLAALFLTSWLAQLVTQYFDEANEAKEHGQTLQFWSSDFWWSFGQATFENFQSEFLQILCFVVLTTALIHRGSHESRDSDDELKEQLDRIERRLDSMGYAPEEEPLIGAMEGSEEEPAKARLLDDGDIEAMRIKAETAAIVEENRKRSEKKDD